ncbi:M20/M25/M40 family metallo-hydrolase, partial [Pseudomonadales bacterium]|nr:M20/M25/M40 family metallo-hydrolase [Pseudomonadales bacterium]
IERIMGFTPAISRTDTSLYKAIVKVSEQAFAAPVIPTVAGGFTDSHFFRDLGITSYGYSPFVYAPGEFSGVHGNDERLGVENLKKGVRTLYQLLVDFAAQP